MGFRRLAAAAAALALAGGLAGCSEEDVRVRDNAPVTPSAAPSLPPPPTPGTDMTTEPDTSGSGGTSTATFTYNGETYEADYVSCWSFVDSYSATASATTDSWDTFTLRIETDADFVHFISMEEDWTQAAEWGDRYLDTDPTVSVTNNVWSVSGTLKTSDGNLVPLEAEITCAIDDMYDGKDDTIFAAPDLVVRQDFDLTETMASDTTHVTVDGVAVPTVAAPQCTISDTYTNVSVSGIMEDGGTVDVSINWTGSGRAPSIDANIKPAVGDSFWYWWAEGYVTESPPAIAYADNKYSIGGTFEDFGQTHEIVALIVCPAEG